MAALSLVPLACGGPTFVVSQYEGPPRPRDTIAILRIEGSNPVQLVSVDGEPLGPIERDSRLHIEVLPGEHSVGVANLARQDQPARRVRFIAQAGKLYGAVWTEGAPRLFELDNSSGAPIRDVSMAQQELPPPEPPRAVVPPAPPAPVIAPPPPSPADAGPQAPAGDAAPR
jgi:hypothetical protein